jgi:hypothetical protein
MADLTAGIQKPSLTAVEPTPQACSANDYFDAQPKSKYLLHYINGATPTTAVTIDDPTSVPPAAASGAAAGWADVEVSDAIGASESVAVWIDDSSRFRDSNGRINLVHGTPTTLTLLIFGPY